MIIKTNEYFRVIFPEENDVSFDSLIDLTDQKSELNVLVNYINSNGSSNIPLYNKFFFIGPAGVGKKSLAIAFAKEINVPIVIVSIDILFSCPEETIEKKLIKIYKDCNKIASKFYNCVIFFDGFEYLSTDVSGDESFKLAGIFATAIKKNPNIITFASTVPNCKFPVFMFSEGLFERKINFIYPELKIREELFKRFCSVYPLDENINYNSLARDVYDVTGGDIKRIIKETYHSISNNGKSYISQSDIEEIISIRLYGDKRKKPTEEERKATAYHEAGHAIAGYYSNIQDLNKIDIIHRDESLGITITRINEDKYSSTVEDLKNEIIFALGGYAAEKLILGTTTTGVSQDLYQATVICFSMIGIFGMDEEIGPVSISFSDNLNLEKLADQAELVMQKKIKQYMAETISLIEMHLDEVKAVADVLVEKEVVMIDEMIKIIDEVKAKKDN